MDSSPHDLGSLVRMFREYKLLSQEALGRLVGCSKSSIGDLERGERVLGADFLKQIFHHLGIPPGFTEAYLDKSTYELIAFGSDVGRMVGRAISPLLVDKMITQAIKDLVSELFTHGHSANKAYDLFNRALVFFGIGPLHRPFFDRYFGAEAFNSHQRFQSAIKAYQEEAIRLYSTFASAFRDLNTSRGLDKLINALSPHDLTRYRDRTDSLGLNEIDETRLEDLGYISAERLRKQSHVRSEVARFLRSLADQIDLKGSEAIMELDERTKRRMDALLRQLDWKLPGLFSPLFPPDADLLRREAERVAPRDEDTLIQIAETQGKALHNLALYLTADYMDVYVATSMRSKADYYSVHRFIARLFEHQDIRPLKLRHFDPTHSWIEDRVAKGLVEALMLKRADYTIYMAQKTDTFGKDSEASVALGQGKPVIVYVPKLVVPSVSIDSEQTGSLHEAALRELINKEGTPEDSEMMADVTEPEGLHAKLLHIRLRNASNGEIVEVLKSHWADFSLGAEAHRVREDRRARADYRDLLDSITEGENIQINVEQRTEIERILVATAMDFERRAHVFKEVHPLALQVILSTGVLNGILVARSVESCAGLLVALISNRLQVSLEPDESNYRLIEKTTGSTIRVISRNPLLANAFDAFYPIAGPS